MLLLLAGCADGPDPAPPPPAPVAPPFEPVAVELPPPCPRAEDFADWPGGRRLRLEAAPVEAAEALTLTVSGAAPGDRIAFHLGRACALDCPPALDGACFQPADAVLLGEVVAGGSGEAAHAVNLGALPDGPIALQATAPDGRYLSQVWVDARGEPLDAIEVSPGSLRRLPWAWVLWEVAAGRRATLAIAPRGDDPYVWIERAWGSRRDDQVAFPYETAEPTSFLVEVTPEYNGLELDLELGLEPLAAAVDWFPDADGDGFGDPHGPPIASAVPVPGASADPRDCGDGDPDVHPDGLEVCGDDVDQDCDGLDRPCGVRAAPLAEVGTRLGGAPVSTAGYALAAGDLDGDGLADVAASGTPGWFLTPDRRDREPQDGVAVLLGGDDLAAGDFDGDGIDDLAFVGDGVVLVEGPIGADPVAAGVRVAARQRWDLTVRADAGDATGDGADDLLVGHGTGAALYDGPTWTPLAVVPAVAGPEYDVALADADGDGLADVWTAAGCVWRAPVPAAAAPPDACLALGGDPLRTAGLAVGDLDGDGANDLAIGAADGARVALGPWRDDRAAEVFATVPSGTDQGRLAVARAADGPRLVWRTDHPREVWVGDVSRGGTVDRASGVALPLSASGAADLLVADLDGDGLDEIVVGEPHATVGATFDSGAARLVWGAEP